MSDPARRERLFGLVGRRPVLWSGAVLLFLIVIQALPQGGAVQRASDLVQLALAASATAASVHAAVRERGNARLFWTLVGVGTGFWTLGQLLFTLEQSALTRGSSAVQRGLFVAAAYPLGAAGLVRPDRRRASGLRLALDVALTLGLALFLYFYVLAPFRSAAGDESPWRQATVILQAFFVAGTLAPLTAARGGAWQRVYRRVAWAGLLWFVGNAIVAWFFLRARYRAGVLDIPWTIPFVWIGSAALERIEGTRPAMTTADDPWRDTHRSATVALATMAAVPAVHLAFSVGSPMSAGLLHERTWLALGALLVVVALFAARQLLVLRGAEEVARARAGELERLEARFERAFRMNPAAMALLRASDEQIVDLNDRFTGLTGVARDAAVGRTLVEVGLIVDVSSASRLSALVEARQAARGEPAGFYTPAGEFIEASVSLEYVDVGGERCVLALVEDVREQRRLEERLVQSQKLEAIGRLTDGIAHEFNNLLTAMIAATSLAIEEVDRPDAVRGRLDAITDAGERAAAMTYQLLAFGRRQALAPEVLEPHSVVAGMQSLLQRLIGEDIQLAITMEPRLPRVRADRAQLTQVVLNLVANAREGMPGGGRLTLALSSVGHEERPGGAGVTGQRDVRLEVIDTGTGMNADALSHVFEPFYTTKPDRGLGLAAAYGIVTQSGGRITVESTLGRGTRVNVFLPGLPADEDLAVAGSPDARRHE